METRNFKFYFKLCLLAIALLIGRSLCSAQVRTNEATDYRIVWGPAQNGLRAGVGLAWVDRRDMSKGSVVDFYLSTTETNRIKIGIPKREQRFHFQLFDPNNAEVRKTSAGAAAGKPLDNVKTLGDLTGPGKWAFLFPAPQPPLSFGTIKTLEMFHVRTSGDHVLMGELVVFRVSQQDRLTPIKLPFKIVVPVEIGIE